MVLMLSGSDRNGSFAARSLGMVAIAVLLVATACVLLNGRLRWRYELEDVLREGPFAPDETSKLCELVEEELESWDPSGKCPQPRMAGTTLIVETTLVNHWRLQNLLGQLRRATGIMVTVEAGIFDPQENFLEEIGVDGGNTFLPD